MNPARKIQEAMENLTNTINENGYKIADMPVEDMDEDTVEFYRYPADTFDYAICAVPDLETARDPGPRPHPDNAPN